MSVVELFESQIIRRGRSFTPQQRHRQNVRARTLYAIRHGRIRRGRCAECGCPNVDAHHLDYDSPNAHLLIEWLCRRHHARMHRKQKPGWQMDLWAA